MSRWVRYRMVEKISLADEVDIRVPNLQDAIAVGGLKAEIVEQLTFTWIDVNYNLSCTEEENFCEFVTWLTKTYQHTVDRETFRSLRHKHMDKWVHEEENDTFDVRPADGLICSRTFENKPYKKDRKGVFKIDSDIKITFDWNWKVALTLEQLDHEVKVAIKMDEEADIIISDDLELEGNNMFRWIHFEGLTIGANAKVRDIWKTEGTSIRIGTIVINNNVFEPASFHIVPKGVRINRREILFEMNNCCIVTPRMFNATPFKRHTRTVKVYMSLDTRRGKWATVQHSDVLDNLDQVLRSETKMDIWEVEEDEDLWSVDKKRPKLDPD